MKLKPDEGEPVSITASEQTSEALRRAAEEIALELSTRRRYLSAAIGPAAIASEDTVDASNSAGAPRRPRFID